MNPSSVANSRNSPMSTGPPGRAGYSQSVIRNQGNSARKSNISEHYESGVKSHIQLAPISTNQYDSTVNKYSSYKSKSRMKDRLLKPISIG